jgi:hypothetical protein
MWVGYSNMEEFKEMVVNLFTNHNGEALEGFEGDLKLSKQVKHKRIHYKDVTYTKDYSKEEVDGIIDVSTWGKMEELYKRLAFHFPIYNSGGLFKTEGELIQEDEETIIYDFGMVRSWKNRYYKEQYKYYYVVYEGQEFEDIGAEIKGTESLGIEERIWLHSCLLDRLEDGETIEEMNMELEYIVNLFLNGVRLRDLVVAEWLKSQLNKGI